MACWDGTFDPVPETPSQIEERIRLKNLKRIEAYEKSSYEYNPKAFWLAPDRWDGIDKPNLKDPGSEAFWMRVREAIAPPPPPKPVEPPKAPERPVPPAMQQIEGKWPCGCPSYKGKTKWSMTGSNTTYQGIWETCNNCGSGWAEGTKQLVYRFRQRYT